jgi:sigma-B regulation protein RsbU (phosphoserine phosphatase)
MVIFKKYLLSDSSLRLRLMVENNLTGPPLTGLYLRNFIANVAGNLTIILLNTFTPIAFFKDWQNFLLQGGWVLIVILIPTIFTTAVVLQYLIQRPISNFLSQVHRGNNEDDNLQIQAEQRLLNLPVLLGLTNLILWTIASLVFMPVLFLISNIGVVSSIYIIFRGVIIGLMSSFISFFLIDAYSRKKLIPWFFPKGRLANVPGTIKISILKRIRVLYGSGTGAPMLILLGTLALVSWEMGDANISPKDFSKEIIIFIIVLYAIFVAIALSLNFLVGKSILAPVKAMMEMVNKVRRGDFHHKVQVDSNDELGVLGDGMNEMTEGLIERDRIRQSLYLAQEVQQALLPSTDPKIHGLEIASTSVYCDETGGDYYDFLKGEGEDAGKLNVVVGDVSGHGISSALVMATARAMLRQRSALSGSLSEIVTDVNRLLALDVEESGSFMTMFNLTVDLANGHLRWVRAGHDPAILYDPTTDLFEELRGEGMALGVDVDNRYEEYKWEQLHKDQIILLGTDGIWEARNPYGIMFGKEPIYNIIRKNTAAGAKEILTSIFDAQNRFLEGSAPEDDVTLIVIRIAADGIS